MENNSRAQLGDKTNVAKEDDSKARKRERDRARWHAMSQEKKDAIYKRRRESYHQRKNQQVIGTINYNASSNKENVDPAETNDWLHRNDSYETHNIVDENMRIQLSYEQDKESTIGFTNTPVPSADEICVQRTSKSIYDIERYKNMTLEQRQTRRERQRQYNTEPKRKEALKLSKKKFNEVRKHTLHPESIVMENPLYIPEVVWSTTVVSGAHDSTIKPSDWVIPEISATPLYIPPPHEEVADEGCDELLLGHMTQISHVPSGQRHALLTRRNTMFERRICSNTRSSNKESDCMTEDRVDGNTPMPQSSVTHNENAGPNMQATSATLTTLLHDDECMDKELLDDNIPLPQSVLTNNERTGPNLRPTLDALTTPLFNDSDDDEGDIFEEDEKEDEGYLFAGQDEEDDDDVQVNDLDEDTSSVPA